MGFESDVTYSSSLNESAIEPPNPKQQFPVNTNLEQSIECDAFRERRIWANR